MRSIDLSGKVALVLGVANKRSLAWAIAEHLHQELGGQAFEPPEILRRMVAEGRLGRKSGRGFYEW